LFQTVVLTQKLKRLWNLEKFICARVKDKSVLHVGAAGNIYHYLPNNPELYFHYRLENHAAAVTGIDIDQDGIAHAATHGLKLECVDCQTMDMGRKFDVIVMLDVIEHLEHPGDALDRLCAHLNPGGEVIMSTPNPTSLGSFIKALFGQNMKIYYDHVTSFQPENFQVLCERHGCQQEEIRFFTHPNRWTLLSLLKSMLLSIIGSIFPRLSNAFLIIITSDKN
jgi:2-polyprenyl-3-methyl-5-hydroxy-6-metoxy-1,4-benzoquinol methylase